MERQTREKMLPWSKREDENRGRQEGGDPGPAQDSSRGQFASGVDLHLGLLCSWEIAPPPPQFLYVLILPAQTPPLPQSSQPKDILPALSSLLWVCFSRWVSSIQVTLTLSVLSRGRERQGSGI